MQSRQICLWLVTAFNSSFILYSQRAATYEIAKLQNVMLSARDGVKLGTDLYLPARNGVLAAGRFPAIVERTPYN